jgi:DNA-binding XRE family transcriptional regulator
MSSSSIEKEHTDRLNKLCAMIAKSLEKEIPQEIEEPLGKVIGTLSEIEKSNSFLLLQKAEMAVICLTKPKPNLQLANDIIKDLENRLSMNINAFTFLFDYFARLNSPLSIVLFGLMVTTVFGHIILILGFNYFHNMISSLQLEIDLVLITVLSGGWGSVISIATRLSNFESKFYDINDHRILFLTGFFKPIIGVIFAIFVSAVIMSGFLPIAVPETNQKYFFAVIGFISGFSERFAKDIISKTKKRVGGEDD